MAEVNESTNGGVPTVVLVHGGFVDGSGWRGVYGLLKDDYDVKIVQNPTISLEGDVAATKMVVGAQSGPVILVGHFYGGVVITEAGNDPKVVGLVSLRRPGRRSTTAPASVVSPRRAPLPRPGPPRRSRCAAGQGRVRAPRR